jgi:hypothetical protein
MKIRRACLTLLTVALLVSHGLAQEPQVELKAPSLRPGEGLALTLGDGEVRTFGEARQEAPMGGLALLVWMRMEGSEWAAQSLRFKCTGRVGPFTCSAPEGHGKVDLRSALAEGCDLAFLAWISMSQQEWKKDFGDLIARVRMEEVFSPFLGRRLPSGEQLPPLTAAWVGAGDLLRTSPEAFLRWLMAPEQSEVVGFGKRLLAGNWVEVKDLLGKEDWWFKWATAAVPGGTGATSAWVVGGRGEAIVVLHLPKGRGKEEGMSRMREILGLKH